MAVYIARVEGDDLTKIGSTRNSPAARVRVIAHHADKPFKLLRVLAGSYEVETWMRHRFAAFHVRHRDWFRFTPEMLTIEPPREFLAGLTRREATDYLKIRRHATAAAIAQVPA